MAPHSSILAWGMLWTEESGVSFVHGVAKSWTQLKLLSTHVHTPQMASMCSRAKIISETFYCFKKLDLQNPVCILHSRLVWVCPSPTLSPSGHVWLPPRKGHV